MFINSGFFKKNKSKNYSISPKTMRIHNAITFYWIFKEHASNNVLFENKQKVELLEESFLYVGEKTVFCYISRFSIIDKL